MTFKKKWILYISTCRKQLIRLVTKSHLNSWPKSGYLPPSILGGKIQPISTAFKKKWILYFSICRKQLIRLVPKSHENPCYKGTMSLWGQTWVLNKESSFVYLCIFITSCTQHDGNILRIWSIIRLNKRSPPHLHQSLLLSDLWIWYHWR